MTVATKRNWVTVGLLMTMIVAMPIVIARRQLLAPRFCSVCLLREDREVWRLPFGGPTIFERHHEWQTPISALLAQKQALLPHEHRWQGARAVANPLDPSAPPIVQSLEFLNVPRVVSFLRDVLNYADPDSLQRWKEITLNLENSRLMDDALRFCRFPDGGFTDRSAFMAWWSRGGARSLAHRIQQVTEPD